MRCNDCSKHIADGAVHAFTDCIGLRVFGSSRSGLNAVDVEHGLESDADEFGAWIMNDAKGSGVTRKPLVLEVHGNMLGSFVI